MSLGAPDKFSFARRVAGWRSVSLERRDARAATFDHDV
jgi:hypothetical protein